MRVYYFLMCLWFCLPDLQGQDTYVISGTVKDEPGNDLTFGDVVLFSQENKPIKYAWIDKGQFELDPLPMGEYRLEIHCLGYEKYTQEFTLNKDEKFTIFLKEDANQLNEVTVTAQRNTVENVNGNLKITIDNSIFASQATSLDVLSMMPTVIVSPDQESLSVIGRGNPLIYLGKQRISMDELKAIPVEQIKTIEIVNNPSVRYEADGRVVVLITRKLNFTDGIKISLSEVASFKRRFNNYAGINTSFKKNRWEFRSNFNFNRLLHWESIASDFTFSPSDFSSSYRAVSVGPRPQFVAGAGIYYQINDGDYFSLNSNLRSHVTTAPISTDSKLGIGASIDEIKTFSDAKEHRDFWSHNVNYNKKIKKIDANLFLGAQYSTYERDVKSTISDNYNNTEFVTSQSRDQNNRIEVVAFRVDFEKEFEELGKWEIGSNIYTSDTEAFQFFEFVDSSDTFTSNYDYKEQNYAAYTQWSGQWKTLNYVLGLRSETNRVKGGFEGASSLLVDRNQTVLFPRARFTLPLDSIHSLALNYARSIQRPGYLNTTAVATFINPFLEYNGNVNLRSTIRDEVSLNWQIKNQSIGLQYMISKDPVNRNLVYNPSRDLVIMSPENFDRQKEWRLTFTSPVQYKFWSATHFIMAALNQVEDVRAVSGKARPYLYVYANHQFRLPQQLTLGINARANTKRFQGVIETNAMIVVGVSASKSFGKNWNASISFQDIFRAMNFDEIYTINEVSTRNTFFADGQNLSLSLRYSFGRIAKSTFQNKDVDENLNRMR